MLLDWHLERGKTFGKDLHNTQFSEKRHTSHHHGGSPFQKVVLVHSKMGGQGILQRRSLSGAMAAPRCLRPNVDGNCH